MRASLREIARPSPVAAVAARTVGELFRVRSDAPNGGDQRLKLDRFGFELVAARANGLRSLVIAYADMPMIGMWPVWASFLRRRTTSQQSASGISRSIRITSGCSVT